MRKSFIVFLPVFLCLVLIYCSVGTAIQTSESIADKVFRLHIIANSDKEEDQIIKLKIRDELLKVSAEWYTDCNNVHDAVTVSKAHLKDAEAVAQGVLNRNHYPYQATACVDKELFDTRHYEHYTLPSGIYHCLKIILGKGEGHNWWCVLFPSVCLSACSEDFNGVLTEEEQQMIDEDYTIKFKIIELYETYIKGNSE